MSKPLSRQAQAVDRAIAASIQLHGEMIHARHLAAAALRAAVDQVAPLKRDAGGGFRFHRSATAERLAIRRDLLAIAAELEAGG